MRLEQFAMRAADAGADIGELQAVDGNVELFEEYIFGDAVIFAIAAVPAYGFQRSSPVIGLAPDIGIAIELLDVIVEKIVDLFDLYLLGS